MLFQIRFVIFICAVLLSVAISGCAPGQGQADDEKEPHFMLGQSRVNAMDYQGAVEAFEESLEVNPRSAPAHYQLAMLYDTKVTDPAAAIYHYQQYLKFDSNAANAVIVRQRIDACKQQLAADVLALPSTSATQQQLEKLVEQNRQLQDEVEKWRAYYTSQLAAAKTNSLTPQNNFISQSSTPAQNSFSQNTESNHLENFAATHATTGTARMHTVASGETAAAISRKYNVKLSALQAANPGVNLSKLHVGQILKIPTQ